METICIVKTFAGLQATKVPFSFDQWQISLKQALNQLGYDKQETEFWVDSLPESLAKAQIEAALGGFVFSFCYCQAPPCALGLSLTSWMPKFEAETLQISTQNENRYDDTLKSKKSLK